MTLESKDEVSILKIDVTACSTNSYSIGWGCSYLTQWLLMCVDGHEGLGQSCDLGIEDQGQIYFKRS